MLPEEIFLNEGVSTLSIDLVSLEIGLIKKDLQYEGILEDLGLHQSLVLDTVGAAGGLFILLGVQTAGVLPLDHRDWL